MTMGMVIIGFGRYTRRHSSKLVTGGCGTEMDIDMKKDRDLGKDSGGVIS